LGAIALEMRSTERESAEVQACKRQAWLERLKRRWRTFASWS
jgi:hypothetical protein